MSSKWEYPWIILGTDVETIDRDFSTFPSPTNYNNEIRGEGDDRGWDGWMASLTQWTWVWVNSRSWWWSGRPGVLQSMGSKRVGHDWVIELNSTTGYSTNITWKSKYSCDSLQCIICLLQSSWTKHIFFVILTQYLVIFHPNLFPFTFPLTLLLP